MSHNLFSKYVVPAMKESENPVFFIILDNLRYDQWKTLRPLFATDFWIDQEDLFYSILPTTTQYSRNAIFAGMMPAEIERRYADKWGE